MLRMNVVVNRLVSIAVCAAALLPVRAGGRLDSLYARLDKAIASSDAYVARREARITALRQRMGKARGAEAYGVAMSLYAEYKPYMNDSALAWLDRAAGMARAVGDDAELFERLLTVVLVDVPGRSVRLEGPAGHGVEVSFDGFDYLGVWTASVDAPFVAIEPWVGCATAYDESDVFEEKRGTITLAPGESCEKTFSMRPL